MAKQKKQAKGSRGSNRNLTQDVLAKYRQRPDTTETASGLIYRIIDDAQGEQPGPHHRVKVHQRIMLGDGTVIDDTYKKGLPEDFAISEAIEGLQEALQWLR